MTLHVITPLMNPAGYSSRYKLYDQFVQHISTFKNIKLYTAEMVSYKEPSIISKSANHIKVGSSHVMWYKENLINIGIANLLPFDWQYLAWIDGDITFLNKNWVEQTIEALQRYDMVQPFKHMIDLDYNCNPINTCLSFGYSQKLPPDSNKIIDNVGHCGFAWACTRRAFEKMRGLFDVCILGSADLYMTMAFIGKVDPNRFNSPGLYESHYEWNKDLRMNISYVEGAILHNWHGNKDDRKYVSRREILKKHCFNPKTDLSRHNNILQFAGNKPKLEEDIKEYFMQRNEDSKK